MTDLQRRVRKFLKKQKKNQGEFAQELGISEAFLSQILSGKRQPSLPLAVKLEELTGVPARDFAGVA